MAYTHHSNIGSGEFSSGSRGGGLDFWPAFVILPTKTRSNEPAEAPCRSVGAVSCVRPLAAGRAPVKYREMLS